MGALLLPKAKVQPRIPPVRSAACTIVHQSTIPIARLVSCMTKKSMIPTIARIGIAIIIASLLLRVTFALAAASSSLSRLLKSKIRIPIKSASAMPAMLRIRLNSAHVPGSSGGGAGGGSG